MNEQLLWHWTQFSYKATGRLLAINYIDIKEDNIFMGHVCPDGAPAITCVNGDAVRHISMFYKFTPKEFVWN